MGGREEAIKEGWSEKGMEGGRNGEVTKEGK